MTQLKAVMTEQELRIWIDALARAIKFADEQRAARAWSEVGCVLEAMRARKRTAKSEDEA